LYFSNTIGEGLYIVKAVVNVERGASGGWHVVSAAGGPRAMVTHAYSDSEIVEHLPNIVRVYSVDNKGNCRSTVYIAVGADDSNALDCV
jgi:hypothetical protein